MYDETHFFLVKKNLYKSVKNEILGHKWPERINERDFLCLIKARNLIIVFFKSKLCSNRKNVFNKVSPKLSKIQFLKIFCLAS